MSRSLHAAAEAVVTLGSWPDWVAAVGTTAAFLIAAISYFRSTRDASKGQARLVYAKIIETKFYEPGEEGPMMLDSVQLGGGEGLEIVREPGLTPTNVRALMPLARVVVRIHNGSNELVGPGKLQLVDSGHKKIFDQVSMPFGPVEPRSDFTVEIHVGNPHHPNQPSIETVMLFRDSSSRWWKREGIEPIERIHDDPNNMLDTPAERAQRARNAALFGLGELEPLPVPSVRARWHRLMRRLRGKPPIP